MTWGSIIWVLEINFASFVMTEIKQVNSWLAKTNFCHCFELKHSTEVITVPRGR